MGKIVVSENVTLDRVVQDPTGEEGFRHGGWFHRMGDEDREEWTKTEFHEALGAEALRLLSSRAIGDGLVHLTYQCVREA